MDQIYLSIIIPAYNEATRISKTLLDIDKHLRDAPYRYEVLVVDDGSIDDTVKIIEGMRERMGSLVLIKNKENKGKGGVVKQGMLLATGKVRLFMDADNSTSIDQYDLLSKYLSEGYDVAIGSRAAQGATLDPPQSFIRRCTGRALNIIVRALLLPNILDTQCGFKAFTDIAAKDIFNESQIPGWGFDIEILSIAKNKGYKIKEVPIHWKNIEGSHVRFSAGIGFLRDVVKIRWWIWENRYAQVSQ